MHACSWSMRRAGAAGRGAARARLEDDGPARLVVLERQAEHRPLRGQRGQLGLDGLLLDRRRRQLLHLRARPPRWLLKNTDMSQHTRSVHYCYSIPLQPATVRACAFGRARCTRASVASRSTACTAAGHRPPPGPHLLVVRQQPAREQVRELERVVRQVQLRARHAHDLRPVPVQARREPVSPYSRRMPVEYSARQQRMQAGATWGAWPCARAAGTAAAAPGSRRWSCGSRGTPATPAAPAARRGSEVPAAHSRSGRSGLVAWVRGRQHARTLGSLLACAWNARTCSVMPSICATTSVHSRSPKPRMVVITFTYSLRAPRSDPPPVRSRHP